MIVIPLLSPLYVHQMQGSRWWLTLYDYSVMVWIGDYSFTIFTPAGYRYDRSSIPWEGVISKDSLGCIAPLIHDALYQCHGSPASRARYSRIGQTIGNETHVRCEPERTFTRKEADEIFRAVMLADGVKPWRATVAYWAVRIFGGTW